MGKSPSIAVRLPEEQQRGVMNDVVDEFVATLRKTQFMPPHELVAYQRGLLENLLRHARSHVPFYRDSGRLDPVFGLDNKIDWTHWDDIALLTRHEIRQAGEQLRSQDLPSSHGRAWPYTTSGSSGEPITIWHTDLSNGVV